ncbi:MAG: sugar-binding transcriptional regulator [Hyphomicrobiales bacterium]
MGAQGYNLRKRKPGKVSGDNAVIEAAWMYYHEDLNQNEIAKRLHVSRATVVNYLQEARELGMIRLSMRPEVFTTHELAVALRDKFSLQSAYIVPDAPQGNDADIERVAKGAAEWLPELLQPGDRLGVAWGQTIYALAEALEPTHIDDLYVSQLVGSMTTPYGFTAEICSTKLSQKLGANCINLHVPAIVSDPDLASRLRQEPIIRDQLAALSNCNKALFAIGTCTAESHVVVSGVASTEMLASYVGRGAIGVMCGQFIDVAGKPIDGPLSERLMSVSLSKLVGLEMGLLVSVGKDRVKGMVAACVGGYATHIVTDAATATAMLDDV